MITRWSDDFRATPCAGSENAAAPVRLYFQGLSFFIRGPELLSLSLGTNSPARLVPFAYYTLVLSFSLLPLTLSLSLPLPYPFIHVRFARSLLNFDLTDAFFCLSGESRFTGSLGRLPV